MISDKMMLLKLDQLVATSERKRPGFYVVEIKEAPDTRYDSHAVCYIQHFNLHLSGSKIYIVLGILITISTGVGAAYAGLQGDIGTGIAIASYILTCLSLMLALLSVGQWLGLSKPDSFSFAYDIKETQIIGATHIEQAFSPSKNYLGQN